MHELSIVVGIVEIAEKAIENQPAYSIVKIDLEIGTMAGVIPEALDLAWDSAIIGSSLEKAVRNIEWIQAIAQCDDCSTEFNILALYDPCPKCGSFYSTIKKGKELRVKTIDIEQIND